MRKGNLTPWVVVTLIVIFVCLGIFIATSGESKFTEKIDEMVEKNKEYIEGGGILSPPSCEDSDGGRNYFTAGSASTYDETFDDSCDSGVLTEYWCNGDEVETVAYACPNGCSDGACAGGSFVLEECEDSDGGMDYFTYGTVSMEGEEYADKCIILQGISVLVREYLCEKIEDNPVRVAENVYQCPEGCENGACIDGD